MNPYLSITFRTFTIWVMAAVLNGSLSGIYLAIIEEQPDQVIAIGFICGLCSLFFSIPGFFVFWIVMLIAINAYKYQRALFRMALSAGMIIALLTGTVSIHFFKAFYSGEWFLFPLFILLSAISSIMMHFNLFKKSKRQTI